MKVVSSIEVAISDWRLDFSKFAHEPLQKR